MGTTATILSRQITEFLLRSVRLQEHSAEQLSSMKAEHLGALDQLRATHALEHSSSKVAELANKLSTQEVLARITYQPVQCQHGMLDHDPVAQLFSCR